MKQGKKVIVFILLILVILTACWIGYNRNLIFNNKTNDNQEKTDNFVENSEMIADDTINIQENKFVGNIGFSNIKIKLIDDKKCEVTANIKNISDEYLEPTNIEIRVLNENGEVEEIFGGIVTTLIPEEESVFTTYVLADITDAHDLEFCAVEG